MEDGSAGRGDPFWCHICSVNCGSIVNLQSHFLGLRHKKAEEALQEPQTADEDDGAKEFDTLEEQINACENAEPALGLEYIYEFQVNGVNRYECQLCNCFLGRTHMFTHIIGARHRFYYITKHHPTMGITNTFVLKGPKKMRKLREVSAKVEKEFGRKQINVLKGDVPAIPGKAGLAPTCTYQVDNNFYDMDFANDDFTEIEEEKPAPEEHVVTFLELKRLHEASLKEQAPGQKNVPPAAEPEKETPPDNSDKNAEPCNVESTHEQNAFSSDRELFEFLASFKILEHDDVHFLMKVSYKLRKLLDCHKEDLERKKMAEQEENIAKSAVPCPPEQESDSSNKKVSFRISGPPTEKKTLVSNPLLSQIEEDVQEENSSNQTSSTTQPKPPSPKPPERAAAASVRNSLSSNQSSSTTQPKPPSPKPPERAAAASVRNEHRKTSANPKSSKSSYPGERTGMSAGFVTPRAENRHEGFRNVSHFPVAPNTTEQVRNSPRFPPSRPHAEESMKDSAGFAVPRPPSSSERFRNVPGPAHLRAPNPDRQTGNPPPFGFRAPFPPQVNPVRKAAPSLGNNDVTAMFFESIKNLEVSEVVSTLNKITNTNPALRGIHVPSLVQYLLDTGKLKPPRN